MKNLSIINSIDPSVLLFLKQLTEPWKNDHDVQMFFEILNGKSFEEGNVLFSLRIGSDRRINGLPKDEKTPALFYDEFNVHLRITSQWLRIRAALFHNTVNRTEVFLYNFKSDKNPEFPEQTLILPGGNGRKPEIFFNEIYLLLKQNREIRVYSEVGTLNRTNK
jgi:hypothetical protein